MPNSVFLGFDSAGQSFPGGITVIGDTSSDRFMAANGSAALPSLSFTSDPDTGLYWGDANGFYGSVGGTAKYRFGTADLRLGSTTALTWNDGQNVATGSFDVSLSRNAANQLRLADGDQFLVGDGIAGAPSYSFASNPDTGIYINGSQMRWSVDGILEMAVSANTLAMLATSPALTLNDVTLSRGAANRLDLATGDSLYLVSGGLGVGEAPIAAGYINAISGVRTGNFQLASHIQMLGGGISGQLNLLNWASSTGIGLDVATDAILKVRTKTQGAYATVDALGYSVGGVAGASKAAGPVVSITVVNGIVTAIS